MDNKTYKEIISKDHDGWMHYQPTYTNTIKKAISALINNLGKEKSYFHRPWLWKRKTPLIAIDV